MAEKKATATKTKTEGFTQAEREAMKERARELKAERSGKGKKDGEADLLAKIAEMPEADRVIAERIHEIVKANAPDLISKTWYGMPAYADKDGKVVCFFQPAAKFGARYASLGFEAQAHLDDGEMWPTAFAVTKITPAVEKEIASLVKKAVS